MDGAMAMDGNGKRNEFLCLCVECAGTECRGVQATETLIHLRYQFTQFASDGREFGLNVVAVGVRVCMGIRIAHGLSQPHATELS